MATRAESFKADQIRSRTSTRTKKAKAKARVRKEHEAQTQVTFITRQTHNEAPRARAKSAYELEPGTRKSTRIAKNRIKVDSTVRAAATAKSWSPSARARRGR